MIKDHGRLERRHVSRQTFLASSVLVLLFSTVSTHALADIGGLWKNAEAPVWLSIDLSKQRGEVTRNDEYPERVGRELLKDITPDSSESNTWQAQVYAERFSDYRDVVITQPSADVMVFTVKVGFISRSFEWTRATPETTPQPAEEESS